jgi:hypothetical protein
MKKLFLLTFLLLPAIAFGQAENPYKYLKLDNGSVFFERVYNIDSASAQEVESLLISKVPSVKDLSEFSRSSDVITGRLKDCLVDYKRYGGKWGNTLVLLNHPMFASISIVWKENKYRVTVSNIYFMTAGFGKMKLDDTITKKRGQEFDQNNIVLRGGTYLEQYLSDLFDFSKAKPKSDW